MGTYQLRSINDRALPATYIEDGQLLIEVTQGTLVIRSDGSFEHTLQLRVTQGGQVSTDSGMKTGAWESSRDNYLLVPENGSCADLVAVVGDRLFLDDCETGNRLEYAA